jgi:hypothetical protein
LRTGHPGFPPSKKIARRQDGEHEVNCRGGNQKKEAAKTTSFVFVVVLGALVLGCAMGASGIYAPPIHWVGLGTGTPKDRDEVNKREVCECDG